MALETTSGEHPQAGTARPSLILPAAALLSIIFVSWFSLATKPAEALVVTWWPASGIAIGAAIRMPKRHLWWFSLASGLVVLGTNLAEFPTPSIAIAACIGISLEVWIGATVLRWGTDDVPALQSRADLARLLVAGLLAATAFDVVLSATAFAVEGPGSALFHLASAGPRRFAGILLITTLFMQLPDTPTPRFTPQVSAHLSTGLIVASLVFLTDQHFPLAFLPLVPPIWSALMIPVRWLTVELIGIAAIASYGSASGHGPFAFSLLGPTGGAALLQVYEAVMVGFALVLALTAARERTIAELLTASEVLYRRSFENSVSGMLIAHRRDQRWTVETANPAATQLLPQVRPGESDVADLLGPAAVSALDQADAAPAEGPTELELADGRHLTASITPLSNELAADSYSIQLIDITDTLIAQRLMEADLTRAQQVQQALSPRTLPIRRGWEHAAASLTAREVGGDFYDLRISGSNAAMALGDVMGKGMGAGILAAATRTALRASNVAAHPAAALADSARVIEDDLANADAFVTLSCASIDLITGQVRLVDAGHGLSFALRQDHSVERLATFDFPLGLGNDWRELHTQLAPGETLLMVSDGVLEMWGTSIDELITAIETTARACADQPPSALVDALCTGKPGSPERCDDATAVLLRREESTS